MTFVAGFEHDVFVSYASVDNHPPVNVERGWVTTLVQELQRILDIELGGAGRADIWMDYQLKANDVLTDTLLNTLDRSATLLIILSTGYMESPWCERELNAFLSKAKKINDRGQARVFLVEKRQLDWDEKPEEIRDIKGIPFWVKDLERTHTLGDPTPRTEEIEYYRRVDDLARAIADQLKRTECSVGEPISHNDEAEQQQVLLADVTDDLAEKRDDAKRYLQQQGIAVIDRNYSNDPEECRAQLKADLEHSKVFVQLLSQIKGRCPAGADRGYPSLRFEIAREHDVQILQWHQPGLSVDDLEDGAQKELLLQPTVIAEPFEQFKSRVVDAAKKKPAEKRAEPSESLVFLNYSSDDEDLAAQLREWVDQQGFGYLTPMTSGRPEENREALTTNVQESDAMVLLYGQAAEGWVRGQLLQFRKLKGGRQKGLAIIEGPPADKPSIGMKLPGMKVLNCRNEIDWKVVQGFLDEYASVS